MADQPQFHVVADEPRPGFFSNVIAIIGFIILIVVVIWGLVHLASLSKGWLSGISLFNKTATPSIQVTAPASIIAGDPFTVSWKYTTTEKGNYALLYKCARGVQLTFGETAPIPCGAAYTVGALNSATLSSKLTGTSSSTIPLSVIFLPSSTSSKQVQGSATISIRSTSGIANVPAATANTPVVTPTKPTPSQTPSKSGATTPAPVYKSPADLSVRIIALGVIDSTTGQFVNRAPLNQYEIAAAQFDVSNIGGTRSGVYYFSSVLPTATSYTYESPAQTPLAPGDHMINTLRWTQASAGGTFSVTVTGDNSADQYNNFASQWFGGAYYPQQQPTYYPEPAYYQPQPTYYPQYQY